MDDSDRNYFRITSRGARPELATSANGLTTTRSRDRGILRSVSEDRRTSTRIQQNSTRVVAAFTGVSPGLDVGSRSVHVQRHLAVRQRPCIQPLQHHMRVSTIRFLVAATFILFSSCTMRHAPQALPAADGIAAPEQFLDLQPGWRLRVVTPILKSGGYSISPKNTEINGSDISIRAGAEFLGYETALYNVKRNGSGVLIQFASAAILRDGKTEANAQPLVRLFEIPRGLKFVRILYLLRFSGADHTMGVIATADQADLQAFTQQVQNSPEQACASSTKRFCSWIPDGIAVRAELFHPGSREWQPVQ